MENNITLKVYDTTDDQKLIEVNKQTIDNKTYVLLLQDAYPHSFFVGECNNQNQIELLNNRVQATLLMTKLIKSEQAQEIVKKLLFN